MKHIHHIIALIVCLIGMYIDRLTLIGGAIIIMLDMIYSELKKLNDK